MTNKTTTKIYTDDLPRLEQVKSNLRKATGEPVYNQDAIKFLLDEYLKNKEGR